MYVHVHVHVQCAYPFPSPPFSVPLQFMVMSFTRKELAIFDDEDALQSRSALLTFTFSQIYTVRTLNQGEHEIMRVKQSDLKRILVVSEGV